MTQQGQVCRRFTVDGRVQGVFFRASAREQARRHQLSGWVRNLADGRVEAVARGDAAAVEHFATWLKVGPPAAKVTAVASEVVSLVTPQSFEIR